MAGLRGCGLDLLPVCFVSILFITLAISFTVAVSKHDVFPWFPTISDTATKSPESNIFAQLVNLASFIGFVLLYIRFLQVKRDVQWLEGSRVITHLNRFSFVVGMITMLGTSVVANFPEKQVLIVHVIAALTLFTCGVIFCWLQVAISFQMKRFGLLSSCMYSTRVSLSIFATISFVLCFVMDRYAGKKASKSQDNLHWKSTDPGYKEHVISDAFEWLMVFFFLLMFLTLVKELRYSRLQIKLVGYRGQYEPIMAQQPADIQV